MKIFFAAMRNANNADLSNFLLWYSQAGTPVLKVKSFYNSERNTYTLKFRQEIPPTPGQLVKEMMFIPVAVGLLDSNGKDLPLTSVYNGESMQTCTGAEQSVSTVILRIEREEEEFVFVDIPERPILSLLRNFSAPVHLVSDITDHDLYFLLAHDSDKFNRWEAGHTLAAKLMLSLVDQAQQNQPLSVDPKFVNGLRSILCDSSLDKEFIAKAITLPGEGEIMDLMKVADPDAVHTIHRFVIKQLASELRAEFLRSVEANQSSEEYDPNHESMGRRALKNTAFAYLASSKRVRIDTTCIT